MQEAIAAVRSLEVREEEGRVVGLLEGRPAADGEALAEVLGRVLSLALQEEAGGRRAAERLALYYGDGISPEEARCIGDGLRLRFPGLEVETLDGGQPGRGLLVSVE
jgi:dihydroxyacetone kinase-like predicted kinase